MALKFEPTTVQKLANQLNTDQRSNAYDALMNIAHGSNSTIVERAYAYLELILHSEAEVAILFYAEFDNLVKKLINEEMKKELYDTSHAVFNKADPVASDTISADHTGSPRRKTPVSFESEEADDELNTIHLPQTPPLPAPNKLHPTLNGQTTPPIPFGEIPRKPFLTQTKKGNNPLTSFLNTQIHHPVHTTIIKPSLENILKLHALKNSPEVLSQAEKTLAILNADLKSSELTEVQWQFGKQVFFDDIEITCIFLCIRSDLKSHTAIKNYLDSNSFLKNCLMRTSN